MPRFLFHMDFLDDSLELIAATLPPGNENSRLIFVKLSSKNQTDSGYTNITDTRTDNLP